MQPENFIDKIQEQIQKEIDEVYGFTSPQNELSDSDCKEELKSECKPSNNGSDPFYTWDFDDHYAFAKIRSYKDVQTDDPNPGLENKEMKQQNEKNMEDQLSVHERIKLEAMKKAEEVLKRAHNSRRKARTEGSNPYAIDSGIYIKPSYITPDQLYGEDKKRREQINVQKRCAASEKSFRNVDPCSKIDDEEMNFLNSIKNIK